MKQECIPKWGGWQYQATVIGTTPYTLSDDKEYMIWVFPNDNSGRGLTPFTFSTSMYRSDFNTSNVMSIQIGAPDYFGAVSLAYNGGTKQMNITGSKIGSTVYTSEARMLIYSR